MAEIWPLRWITDRRLQAAERRRRRGLIEACLRTPGGQELVAHLIETFHILTPTAPRRPAMAPEEAHRREGERRVVLHILELMRVKPQSFAAMSTKAETENL